MSLLLLTLSGPALAEVPRVVTDIAPVQSLVAQVMSGLGTPEQVLPPGGSPHDFSLRPSQARSLSRAEAVIWIGPELTPGLADAVAALGEGASLPLLSVPDTMLAPAGEDDHGHGHDAHDPHGWLDPENGKLWLDAIATLLGRIDPENADIYTANAAAGRSEIDAAAARATSLLEPVRGKGYVTRHDGYGGFEARFGLPAFGAIAAGDATDSGAAHLSELRAATRSGTVVCVFNEVGESDAPVRTVTEGTDARTGTLDPLGTTLEPGAGLYPRLIDTLARDLAACLAD